MNRFAISLLIGITLPLGGVFGQSSVTLDQALLLKVVLEDKPSGEPSAIRDLAKKALGQEFEVSRYTEFYKRLGADVSVKSDIQISKVLGYVGGIDKVSRSSSGFFRDGRFMPLQVTEQRESSKPIYAAQIDHKKKRITYLKGRTLVKEESFQGDLTDLIQLPYRWLGGPVVSKSFRTSITDARKIYRNEEFIANDMEVLFLGQKTAIVRFARKRQSADDEGIEFWVRKRDGLPIRIMVTLNKKYGLKIDAAPYRQSEIIVKKN
jgi:hypothetical protein